MTTFQNVRAPSQSQLNALIALFNQGKFAEALASAENMTQQFPRYGMGWKMSGVVLSQLGRNAEALPHMQRSVALLPNDAEAHNNLGIALQASGNLQAAADSYRHALRIHPGYVQAQNNLSSCQQALGDLEQAERGYRQALKLNPDYAKAHCNLASLLLDQQRFSEAESSYRQALRINPNDIDACSGLATTLQKLGRLEEAEALHRHVLINHETCAAAHFNLANTLSLLGQAEAAEACYRKALELDPNSAEIQCNLGIALHNRGDFAAAEQCYRLALQSHPGYAQAQSNIGKVLYDTGRMAEAEIEYRKALQLQPDLADVHSNLGGLLHDLGRLQEAQDSYRHALQLKPDFAKAQSNLLFCLLQDPSLDAQTLYQEHCRFGAQFDALRDPRPHHNLRDAERVLQIGFVSGDLRNHAVASFLEPILRPLAKLPGLMLHAYSSYRVDDEVNHRLRALFQHWHDIEHLPDVALAERIRADGIDILIDLSGHTAKNRLPTFARKPAPVQASWMGYPGTTGLKTMDYYLADRYFFPSAAFTAQFSEQIACLPANAAFAPSADAPAVNTLPALTRGYFTFGSFNRVSKLTREVVALWAQLLRALPDSRMLLGGMPEAGKYDTLIDWFSAEQIDLQRLDFHPRGSMSDYLALHQQVDMCLDTFPYNGGTTTLHALWMGVPTLTLAGDTMAGRTGSAVLEHLGLGDFVAHDRTEFMQRGQHWAKNLSTLAELRASCRARFCASAMSQPDLIAAGLEQALRYMWRRWCAGLPALSFDVTQGLPDMPTDIAPAASLEHTLQRALHAHQNQDWDTAETLYVDILREHPHHAATNYNLGVLLVQRDQAATALPFLMNALDADPAHGNYWLTYIDALFRAGQHDEARQILALAQQQGLQGEAVDALLRRLQEVAPEPQSGSLDEIDALVGLFNAGRYQEAERLARAMTEHAPQQPFGWKALGAILKRQGLNTAALLPMQKAAQLSPDDVEAHYNLGVALQDAGDFSNAEFAYRHALKLNPDYADAYGNLGILLQQFDRQQEAEACYRQTLRLAPDNVAAHSNLGVILHNAGNLTAATNHYREAIRLDPNNAGAHNNLGNTLLAQHRYAEAESCYRTALHLNPDYADAHYNLANALKDLLRLNEAVASYQAALQRQPENACAHNNLGILLLTLGHRAAAEQHYRLAIQFDADYAEAWKNLGALLGEEDRNSESKQCYQRAYQLGSNGARVKATFILPAIASSRAEMLTSRTDFEQQLDQLIADKILLDDPLKEVGETNFYLPYHALNDKDLQRKIAGFYAQACPSLLYTAPHCQTAPPSHPKTKIGFFSKFLRTHAVSLCFSKIIEVMSQRDQFEVVLISNQEIKTQTYADFTGQRVLVPNDLEAARQTVAALELDILVYLDIGMEPLSYFLAFARLAPVQCVLAGHPVTTGIPTLDYFISAEIMEPADAQAHYSEKLVRLPTPLAYFARPVLPAAFKTRTELGLPDEQKIYLCPMKLQKLHPDFDRAIARILTLDTQGIVVLFEDEMLPHWKLALLKRFKDSIPAEQSKRIIFLPWIKQPDDFISVIARADVILDPFHFGIGSTSAMTAITGTPLVTKTGEFMRGRVGTAYCQMLGIHECVVTDEEAYAQQAVAIANDAALRSHLSATLLQNNSSWYENLRPIEDFVAFIASLAVGQRDN